MKWDFSSGQAKRKRDAMKVKRAGASVRSPPHVEEVAAAAAATAAVPPHPGLLCPSPSTSAGRPQKCRLDSREALILQPRQSRLHRWLRGGPRGRDATVCRASPQWTVRGRTRGQSAGG